MKKMGLLLILCVLAGPAPSAWAQEVYQKKEIAVFNLSSYDWDIPLQTLGSIDDHIRSVFVNLGRFTVIGMTYRLGEADVSDFIEKIKQFKSENAEIPEQVQMGQEFFTQADMNKLIGSFIVVIPSVVNFTSKQNKQGDYSVAIDVSFSFVNVETERTIGQFAVKLLGLNPDFDNALTGAVNSLPFLLTVEVRKIAEFQIKSGILEVHGAEVIFELGKDMGIKVGDQYEVLSSRVLSSGKQVTEEKGLLLVRRVDQEISYATVLYAYGQLGMGDQIREIPHIGTESTVYIRAVVFGADPLFNSFPPFIVGIRQTVLRGFYAFRPFVELESPLTNMAFSESFPFNVSLGAEYNLFLGRLRITPRVSLGGGFDVITSTEDTSVQFSRYGGNAALEISYLLSRDVRFGLEGGYMMWQSVDPLGHRTLEFSPAPVFHSPIEEEGVMRRFLSILLIAAAVMAAVSCASTGPAQQAAAPQTQKEYAGAGEDPSLLGAMNKAKMDAVRKAIIDIIGMANEQANREALRGAIYGSSNPNAFVVSDSFVATRKDKVGDNYVVEGTVLVRLDAVTATLKARGLLGGEGLTAESKAQTAAQDSQAQAGGAAAEVDSLSAAPAPAATADEQRVIRDYVEHMTYMVYAAQDTTLDPFYAKSAIGIANEFLASNAMETIDIDQIEKLKSDRQKLYEAETGESITITQWIAQKLNADVYIEIDGAVSGETSGAKFYGQANTTLKAYEASTGRLLGSVPFNSPKTISTSSVQAAIINALQTSVYKAMPIAITQAKAYMAKALTNGIKFELVVQKTPDARLMNTFRQRLKARVKDVRVISQTDAETRFDVFLIGSIEDLADEVYNVSEKIPGLEAMKQVLLRGKSVTFNTGM
jgi:hypothetical protein